MVRRGGSLELVFSSQDSFCLVSVLVVLFIYLFFYLYEGRLASISLVFWAVTPLSDESCESSLSEPWA